LCRRSLAIREKALGPDNPDTASSLNSLAALLETKGDYVGAEPVLRRALAIREKHWGRHQTPRQPEQSGGAAEDQGDYEGAEPLLRRALAIREKTLGPTTQTPPPA